MLGALLPEVADETGAQRRAGRRAGCHDTASAVAAVPAEEPDYAYLSSGTWSLMGVEREQPVIHESALALDITNEGGVGGTIRF